MQWLLAVLDLGGTFVFAISGAMVGVRHRLDLFGVLVLSFAAGNAGGIIRDVLIGAVPPAAMAGWRYGLTSIVAGALAFYGHRWIDRLHNPVLLFDAAGLALFAAVGARKALDYGLHPVMAAVLGMLTGIGGGITRDVLVARVPAVLKSELYAVAALLGGVVVVGGAVCGVPAPVAMLAGVALCFGLRLVALRRGWHLPVARPRE